MVKSRASNSAHDHFLEEASICAIFDHENICKLIGMILANDNISIYVAMELLNDTLENFLKIQSEDERIISQKLSSKIVLDCAKGMNYIAKKGYVHRDLAA